MKNALKWATAGALMLVAAASAPARAYDGFALPLDDDLYTEQVIGGLATSPCRWEPCDGYAPVAYYGYAPGYYGAAAESASTYRYSSYTRTTVVDSYEPGYRTYRYRRVQPAYAYRPAYAYYGHPRWHGRYWHRYW